jgi:hypothetical protein
VDRGDAEGQLSNERLAVPTSGEFESHGYYEEIASIVRARDVDFPIGHVVELGPLHGGEGGVYGEFECELPNIVVDAARSPVGWFYPQEFDDKLDQEGRGALATLKPYALLGGPVPNAEIPESAFERPLRIVDDIMHPLAVDEIICPETTYFDCVELIVAKPDRLLVVVDDGTPKGVVAFRDLFDPIGRLCLLRLLFDLEVAAIELFHSQHRDRLSEILKNEADEELIEEFRRYNAKYLKRISKLDSSVHSDLMLKLFTGKDLVCTKARDNS